MYQTKVVAWEKFRDSNYEFSTDGRVRRWGRWRGKYIHLKPCRNGDGHLTVEIPSYGKVYVHSAILEIFVCPRPAGLQALHIDDDPSNNRLGNLCWGTQAQNMAHAIANGLRTGVVLDADMVREMRAEYAAGKSQVQIARERGLKRCTVRDAVNGRTWSWVD